MQSYLIALFFVLLISGHIARSTYSKYIRECLTPDILTKFMCANEARNILNKLKIYENKFNKKKL